MILPQHQRTITLLTGNNILYWYVEKKNKKIWLIFNFRSPSLYDGKISDLLNLDENSEDIDEQFEKTETIVTDIVAQNISGEIFTGELMDYSRLV